MLILSLVKFKFIGQFEKQHEVGWSDHEPLLLAGLRHCFTRGAALTELLSCYISVIISSTWRRLLPALCSCLSAFYSLFPRRPPPPLSYVDTEFTWLYYTAYYTVLQDSVHVKIGFTKNLSRSEKPRYVLTRSNRSYHKCFPVRLFNCSNNQYRELSLYLYLDLDPLINIYTPNSPIKTLQLIHVFGRFLRLYF